MKATLGAIKLDLEATSNIHVHVAHGAYVGMANKNENVFLIYILHLNTSKTSNTQISGLPSIQTCNARGVCIWLRALEGHVHGWEELG